MAVLDDVQQVISNVGAQALGVAAPLLAVNWTDSPSPNQVVESTDTSKPMTLTTSLEWKAPIAGIVSIGKSWEQIILPSGSHIDTSSVVLRIYPQVYLRLKRLYATVIEGKTTNTHQPDRPVPFYFVYRNITNIGSGPEEGKVFSRTALGFSGDLTIHDEHGYPIDPVSVANVFDVLVNTHQTLESKDLLSNTPTTQNNRQINAIGNLGTSHTSVHLIDLFGKPFTNTPSLINNLTAISQTNGWFTITNATTAINRTDTTNNKILFGSAVQGTLNNTFTFPAASTTLRRDFTRLFVIKDFHELLIGVRLANDPASSIEARPKVRDNENINFHFNGNATMGTINNILTNNTTKNIAVSPVIENDYTLPADNTNANAQWPGFPTGLTNTTVKINANTESNFNPSAHFITGTDANVVLVLNGLSQGQAVRIYNRIFLPDAREGRGDGAGSVVRDASGAVAVILKDPFELVTPGGSVTLPTNPNLHVDVVVINSSNNARVFGNVVCTVGAQAALSASETNLLPAQTNNLNSAQFRGISHAGINGLSSNNTPLNGSASDIALALASETTPRDAPRLPTMTRLETIVAGSNSGTWNGMMSGCWLRKDSQNALHRIGSPGSHGGKDFQTLAVQSIGGRISYDFARMGLRHAKNIVERLIEIAKNAWNVPAAATGNTMAASVLQTISPVCETPEFSLINIASFPATFSDFVDNILPNIISGLPTTIRTPLNNALTSLKNNANASRVYDELKQEYSASHFGRRDAFWAAKNILGQARQLIFIEGTFFGKTDYSNTSNDLIEKIKSQLTAHPNLKVIIALTKDPIYGHGYDSFKAREIAKRKAVIDNLESHATGRVIAYHPIGFPGRPLILNTNALIVDDKWALIGSSAFRRRGFMFDGAVDLVCFDKNISDGVSTSIRNLRKSLMSIHLNIKPPATGAQFPNPNAVRIHNMQQAFSTVKDLLKNGGSGLIEPIWDGTVPGKTPIASSAYPSDDIADPDGRNFNTFPTSIYAFLNTLSSVSP